MYQKTYPPARYLFYPLYRWLRRRLHLPSTVAYFSVFLVSAILHAILMLAFGHSVAAVSSRRPVFIRGHRLRTPHQGVPHWPRPPARHSSLPAKPKVHPRDRPLPLHQP